MQFQHLDDFKLIEEAKALIVRERNLLTQILSCLREIDARGIYLARGYPSLFEFCVSELNYSRSEAYIRIQAMRLTRAVPDAEEKIESGQLSLTVAAQMQGTFRRQEKLSGIPIAREEKATIVKELTGVSSRDAEKKLLDKYPSATPPKDFMRPISKDESRITFVASHKLVKKLERLKELTAHKNFEGRLDALIEDIADMALEKLDPLRKANAPSANRGKSHSANQKFFAPRSRYIPASHRAVVWKKASGRCEYVDSVSGRRCGSRHGLQIDHIHEFSKGGGNDVKNLRLLCGAHNRWRGGPEAVDRIPDVGILI